MRRGRQAERDSLISYPDILGLNHESGVLDFLRDYCIGGDKNDFHDFGS